MKYGCSSRDPICSPVSDIESLLFVVAFNGSESGSGDDSGERVCEQDGRKPLKVVREQLTVQKGIWQYRKRELTEGIQREKYSLRVACRSDAVLTWQPEMQPASPKNSSTRQKN